MIGFPCLFDGAASRILDTEKLPAVARLLGASVFDVRKGVLLRKCELFPELCAGCSRVGIVRFVPEWLECYTNELPD